MVSKEEIDRLATVPKVLEEDWAWETNGPNMTGEATIRCLNEDTDLTLRGWKSHRYGFSLLYKSTKVVRRWDNNLHINPDGDKIDGSHKHYWRPDHEDKWAFPVNDIATDDVHQAFQDFADELNIELRGGYTGQQELTSQ